MKRSILAGIIMAMMMLCANTSGTVEQQESHMGVSVRTEIAPLNKFERAKLAAIRRVYEDFHFGDKIKRYFYIHPKTKHRIPLWNELVTGLPNPIIQNGYISVPEAPGLGIDLNTEVIKEHIDPNAPGYFEPTTQWDSERSHDRLWS